MLCSHFFHRVARARTRSAAFVAAFRRKIPKQNCPKESGVNWWREKDRAIGSVIGGWIMRAAEVIVYRSTETDREGFIDPAISIRQKPTHPAILLPRHLIAPAIP